MRTLVLALTLIGGAAIVAQEPPGRFNEEIEVRVIDVDVVVTGRDGKPLTNLTRADFELYEDGKRVEIAYFSTIVDGGLARASKVVGSIEAPAEIAPRSPLTWAVFVDQSNLPPSARNATLQQLHTFMERAVHPDDRGMLATYDGHGFKVRAEGITTREDLLRILAGLQKEGVRPGAELLAAGRIRHELEEALPGDEEILRMDIALLVEEEAARTQKSIEAMGSLFDVLQGVEGRLALVYVGNGFSTLPAMTITEAFRRRFPSMAEEPDAPRPETHQPFLRQKIQRLYQRIIATRAAMYSIDAGAQFGGSPVEDRGSLVVDGVVEGGAARLVEAGSARELAQRTGGLYFRTNPGLADQLEAVRTDLTNYYSLGYRPQGTPGRERAIRVKVNVDGARVRYREAVRERTTSEQQSDALVAGLFSPGQANPLGVVMVLEAPRRASKGRKRVLPVTLKVPLKDLTFVPRGGVHEGGLFFDFAMAANDGTIWQLGTRELPLTIPDTALAKARRQSVSYSVEVPLDTRGTRLSVSVQDRIGETQSVLLVALPEK